MKKIVIIGSPGSGKSTFAQALGRVLNIDILHLDRYFWDSSWKEYPREDRIKIEQDLIKGKAQWIIEGSYLSSSDNRLNAADTIIFLDMPYPLCLWRAITRHMRYRECRRFDIPDGCRDRINLFLIWKILTFPYKERKLLITKIKEIQVRESDIPWGKTIITLQSREQSEAFLRHVAAEWQKEYVPQTLRRAS